MSCQPERMGLAEGMSIVFVTTFASFFLSVWAVFIDMATTATWMIPLLICLAGIATLYVLHYVLCNNGGDLLTLCEQLLGTAAVRLVAVYLTTAYLLDAGLLLRQYSENTLLTALPFADFEIVIGWYALIIALVIYMGFAPIARASYLFLPFAVFGIVLVVALVSPNCNYLYLAPWNGPGFDKLLTGAAPRGGVNLPLLIPFILAAAFQNPRTVKNSVLYGLAISALIRSAAVAAYVAAFGSGAGREKVLPFFELTRLVYISRFINRIEALFILLWAIMGILSIAIEIYVALYLLGRLFGLPTLRPLVFPAVLVITELALMPREITQVIMFHSKAQSTFYNLGTLLIPLLLLGAAVIRNRRRNPCRSDL